MLTSRRQLLAAGVAAPLLATADMVRAAQPDLSGLRDMTTGVAPIGTAERAGRLVRAQQLMRAENVSAVVLEPGSSMAYFTGIRWSRSERPTLAILPVEGESCIVTPFFEEPSVRESLAVPSSVRVWQEDANPFTVAAGFLRERGLTGAVRVEETVRFFVSDGMARVLGRPLASANPVVRGCRTLKTPAELALMQTAADVTMAAYRWTWPRVETGMTGPQIAALMNAATVKLGGSPEFALVLIGEASAYPHGSREVHRVAAGEVVLMDCGCTVGGYQSDISRTFVFGAASKDQRTVWDQVARGQEIAFAAATVGAPAGAVDDAVRGHYTQLGYGPDYRLPGLSHRTGHGIGMDGHEPVNLVRGEATKLAPGMCFSDEPGIYLPGKFGVRLEDCFHMTATGPRWFSRPPASLDAPI